jgi:hypothetical protein
MLKNKNLLAIVAVILCPIAVIWFSTTTHGNPTTYEIQPRISVPHYKSDTVRAIEAYERLMERYMNMTEINSKRTNRDLKEVINKLDSIDDKLTKLSVRISRIEKMLGIEEVKQSSNAESQPKSTGNKIPREYLPMW